jgi:AcrR family transcriptional regulator
MTAVDEEDVSPSEVGANLTGLSVEGLPIAAMFRPNQLGRCQRIFDATIELAREGGYDAVQMRSVAERSSVSIATLYTYFKSRDNLLYRTAISWNEAVSRRRVALRDASHLGGGLDRLEDDVVSSLDDYIANPSLLDMYVRATLTLDPQVVELRRRVLWESWADLHPQLELLAPDIRAVAPRLLTDTFYSSSLRWAFGQIDLADLVEQMRQIVRVLIKASQ